MRRGGQRSSFSTFGLRFSRRAGDTWAVPGEPDPSGARRAWRHHRLYGPVGGPGRRFWVFNPRRGVVARDRAAEDPRPIGGRAAALIYDPVAELPGLFQIKRALDPRGSASCSCSMHSRRYGDVTPIYQRDNGNCHLCGESAPLHTYGQVWLYGAQAASVDHVIPQHFGGSDHPGNLRWAHQSCNSYRGIRGVEEVRMELRGDIYEMAEVAPRSSDTFATVMGGLGGAALGAGLAYHWCGQPQSVQEQHQANDRAILGAVAGAFLGALAMALLRR